MDNLILKRRAFVAEKIQKSFDDDIEKAAHGVYEDNAENRKLNRVGQEYGHAAKEGEPAAAKRGKGDEPKSVGDLVKQKAAEASTEALKRAAADDKAKPEVRDAAKKELEKRNGIENNSNLSAKDSKEIKRIDKKLKNLDYQMKQTIKERDADESYTPSDDPDDFDYYKNTIAAQEKEIARLKKRRENILKNSGGANKGDEKIKDSNKVYDEDFEKKQEDKSTSDFTDEDDKRFNELDGELTNDLLTTNRDEYFKKLDEFSKLKQRKYNHILKESGALTADDFNDVSGIGNIWMGEAVDSNGNMITPYLKITLNKKSDVNKFIKDVKNKLNIELSDDNFEHVSGNRYGGSHYEVCVNPETGEFADDWKTTAAIRESNKNKQDEIYKRKRAESKKQAMSAMKESVTKDSVENLLDDDDVRGHAFSYFNYDDDDECSDEEKEQFKKLKKLGAKISEYFDWKEDGEAETYKRKMQAKGYRLFDISTDDGYMWLLIKNNKLDKGGEIKKSLDSVTDLIEEIAGNK